MRRALCIAAPPKALETRRARIGKKSLAAASPLGEIAWLLRFRVKAFGRKHGTDLWALAAEFARRSPDLEMRLALRLARASIS